MNVLRIFLRIKNFNRGLVVCEKLIMINIKDDMRLVKGRNGL